MTEATEKKKNNSGTWISVVIVILVFVAIAIGANSQNNNSPLDTSESSTITNNTTTSESVAPTQPYIPNYDVTLTNMQLNGFHNSISGQVFNNSSYSISNIEISADAYDCLQNYYLPSSCIQIGEDDNVDLFIQGNTFGSIPSSQEREVSGLVNFQGMPPIQGYLVWTYAITKIIPHIGY